MDGRAMDMTTSTDERKRLVDRMKNQNRQRFSMNYNSYEAAIIDPKLKKLRMLQYTFPDYNMRSTKDYQEGATQTQVSIRTHLSDEENARMKEDMKFEEWAQEKADREEAKVIESMVELKEDQPEKSSLAAHGWVGPPLIVKMRINDFLFIEITPVALPPVLLRLNKGAIDHHTLEIRIVPGPQFVPQVIVMISGLEIYPKNRFKLLSVNKSLARRPSMFLDPTRNTVIKSGGRWHGKKGGMQTLAMSECLVEEKQQEEEEPEDEGFDMPQSWLRLHYNKMTKQKQYRINTYKVNEDTDTSYLNSTNPLQLLFETKNQPSNKFHMPKQMKKFHLDNPLMYAKHLIHSPPPLRSRTRRTSLANAHPAMSHLSMLRKLNLSTMKTSMDDFDFDVVPDATRGRRGTFYPRTDTNDTPVSIVEEPKVDVTTALDNTSDLDEGSVISWSTIESSRHNSVVNNERMPASNKPLAQISRKDSLKYKSESVMNLHSHLHPLIHESPAMSNQRTASEEYALARINRYLHARGASPVSPSPRSSLMHSVVVEEDKAIMELLQRGVDKLGQVIDIERKDTITTQQNRLSIADISQKSLRTDLQCKEDSVPQVLNRNSEEGYKTAPEMSEDEEYKTPPKKTRRYSVKDILPTIKEESPLQERKNTTSFSNLALTIQKEMSPIRNELHKLKDQMTTAKKTSRIGDDLVTIADEEKPRMSVAPTSNPDPVMVSKHSSVSVHLEPPSPQVSSILGEESQPDNSKGVTRLYQRFTKKK